MIYLDYAAHTPADKRVLQAFCEAECVGNPISHHKAGEKAKDVMDTAISRIAGLLHIGGNELIFTSGASEANNTAIKGYARAGRHIGKHIISSPLEHSSVSAPLSALQEQGYEIDLLDIGRDGKIDTGQLEDLLRKDTVLVTLSAVDSELGVVQPIKEVSEILRNYPQCRFHVDATQAIGKINFAFEGMDSVSFSPHKFFGICGTGILWKKESVIMEPLIHGGISTTIYRGGTPAVSLAASTAEALGIAIPAIDANFSYVKKLNQALRDELSGYPGVRINSPDGAVPHILNISVAGVSGQDFQKKLDEYGVCVSVKSACSVPGTPSRAVMAVSRDRATALSSFRISLSHMTTENEIAGFLEIFDTCYKEFKNGKRT